MNAVVTHAYRVVWLASSLAFAAASFQHWGFWWAVLMFFGWPVWLLYHFVIVKVIS